ncbi:hypothetical protein KP509_23G028100 [Ceratopteris richardii]|uniref:Glycosyltransferase n=1 Tax=Ceratopteris richardii TaxID=49495 RepID=A0A8T2RY75_CERRI|nr:hypothetical protein KP509_23G028100 [Ceratopteris richardii]
MGKVTDRNLDENCKTVMMKPHVVAVPCAFFGHITPFMDLCHLMDRNGICVTLITTPRFRNSVKIEEGADIRIGLVDDGLPADYSVCVNDIPNYLYHLELMRWPIQEYLIALRSDVSTLPYTCIVSDSHLGWTQDIANDLGIPRVCFLTSSTIEFSAIFHQPLLVSQGVLPLKARAKDIDPSKDVVTGIPGLPPVHRSEMLTFQQVEDSSDFEFQYFSRNCGRAAESERLLTASFYDLEIPMVKALSSNITVKPIGPMVLLAELGKNLTDECGKKDKEPEEWERWLDKQKDESVIYIAFGSVANLTENEVKAIAGGLELTKSKFIWAFRKGLVGGVEDPFPEGFKERAKQEGRGLVVPWLSQRRLLNHASIAAFFTHSGWGSSMETIHAGLPVLSWPLYGDQCLNCKLITEIWRAGVRVGSELLYDRRLLLSPEHVASSITTLFSSLEYKQNMKKLQELSFQACQPNGSSYQNFFEFVNDMHAYADGRKVYRKP